MEAQWKKDEMGKPNALESRDIINSKLAKVNPMGFN